MALRASTKRNIHSASDWREYTSGDFGADFSLENADGRLPVMIVMTEAGDLDCKNAAGADRSLTGLPQWFQHVAQVATILSTQSAGFIAYWN